MKMRTLIKMARDIISTEVSTVYEEFREDDGSITPENKQAALKLMERMTTFLVAADKTLNSGTLPKKRSNHLRTRLPRRSSNGKRSALEP